MILRPTNRMNVDFLLDIDSQMVALHALQPVSIAIFFDEKFFEAADVVQLALD